MSPPDRSPNVCLPPTVGGLRHAGRFWLLTNDSAVAQGHNSTTPQKNNGTEAKNGSYYNCTYKMSIKRKGMHVLPQFVQLLCVK